MRTSLLNHRRRFGRLVVDGFLIAALGSSVVSAQGADEIKVRFDAAPGPYLVGQGIELRVALVDREQRPKLDLPTLADARIWAVDTSFKPISVGRIGRTVLSENMFLTRLRLVARSAGTLDVPPVVVRLGGRAGRSKPLRLKIENPPIAGRTADFLGGVGVFSAEAETDARQVRVGQEFLYRIRISGPAAWGMSTRPDLARLRALSIGARIEPLPDETVDEPPQRAFLYRIRPSRSGEVVLPPVSISSFDPKIQRYVTQATNGVPLRVVDVPAFDASKLDYRPTESSRIGELAAAMVGLAIIATLAAMGVVFGRRVRRRRLEASRIGPDAARRFARHAAIELDGRIETSQAEAARRANDALVEYARLSVGRLPGALTPDEARESITRASGSDELGRNAARLAARCDRILFAGNVGETPGEEDEAASLSRDARDLFRALGRSGGWRRRLAKLSGSRDAMTA